MTSFRSTENYPAHTRGQNTASHDCYARHLSEGLPLLNEEVYADGGSVTVYSPDPILPNGRSPQR